MRKEKEIWKGKGERVRLSAGESYELLPVMTPTKCRPVWPSMRGEQWVVGSGGGGGGDVKREGKREKEGRERERVGDWRPERV